MEIEHQAACERTRRTTAESTPQAVMDESAAAMAPAACSTDEHERFSGPSTPPNGTATPHPAWVRLTEPGSAKLAWRRAACQDTKACAVNETSRGGLLPVLQQAGLAVPPKTKGAVNAYVTAKLTDELGRAVQSYLAATTDPFYYVSPKENVNYGGKGAGQQLWWSAKKGWRVSQPNRQHVAGHASDAPQPKANSRTGARARNSDSTAAEGPNVKKAKRQRLPAAAAPMPPAERERCERASTDETDPVPIRDEDICMLPVHIEEHAAEGTTAGNHNPHRQQQQQPLLPQPLATKMNMLTDDDDSSSSVGSVGDPWPASSEDAAGFEWGENSHLLLEGHRATGSSETEDDDPFLDVMEYPQEEQHEQHEQQQQQEEEDQEGHRWTVEEEYGATHDRHVESPCLYPDMMAPSPAAAPAPLVSLTQGSPPRPQTAEVTAAAKSGGGGGGGSTARAKQRPQQPQANGGRQAAGGATLTETELFSHITRLADSLPQHQRQLLHQRLGASLPAPFVVEAQPVPAGGSSMRQHQQHRQGASAPSPTPSVLNPRRQQQHPPPHAPPPHHAAAATATAAAAAAAAAARTPTYSAAPAAAAAAARGGSDPRAVLQNKSAGRAAAEPPMLYPGSLEPVAAARWWRRLASHGIELSLVRLLLPRPLKHTPIFILVSIAMDLLAHARWPGQSVGKRLMGLQVSLAALPSTSTTLAN